MKNIIFALSLCSCATTYQSAGFTGGFSETKYSHDTVKITFNGNAYTSSGTVQDYCFLRAADYTHLEGYKYFYILDEKSGVTSHTAQTSPGVIRYDRNTDSATYSGPQYATFNRASNAILIRMSNEATVGYINAEDVRINLSRSLGVELESNAVPETKTTIYERFINRIKNPMTVNDDAKKP